MPWCMGCIVSGASLPALVAIFNHSLHVVGKAVPEEELIGRCQVFLLPCMPDMQTDQDWLDGWDW